MQAPGPPHAPVIPSAQLSSHGGGWQQEASTRWGDAIADMPPHPSRHAPAGTATTHVPVPPTLGEGVPSAPDPPAGCPAGTSTGWSQVKRGPCPTAAPPRPVSLSRCSNNGVTSSLPDNGQQAADLPHTLPTPRGETEAGLRLSPRAPRRHRVSASEAERFWGGGCHCQGRSRRGEISRQASKLQLLPHIGHPTAGCPPTRRLQLSSPHH